LADAELLELIRGGYAAFARSDFEWMIRNCTADVVIVPPPERPSARTYRGRAEFRDAFTDWPSQWDAFELELLALEQLNDRQVLGTCTQRMRAGELELEQPRYDLFTVREGKVARLEMFQSLDQAHEAADAA
jgi:ketosteroid isomerase-like protein